MLTHPDCQLEKQEGGNDGGTNKKETSHNKKETRPQVARGGRPWKLSLTWRSWVLTWGEPDVLSWDLRSSNVRNKDVTVFSFDDVQSLTVL